MIQTSEKQFIIRSHTHTHACSHVRKYTCSVGFSLHFFIICLYQKTKQAINGLIGWNMRNSSWITHTIHINIHANGMKVPIVQFPLQAIPKHFQAFVLSAEKMHIRHHNPFHQLLTPSSPKQLHKQHTIFTNIEIKLVHTHEIRKWENVDSQNEYSTE